MKNEDLYNAISNISPQYLEELSFEKTVDEKNNNAKATPAKKSKLPVIGIICAVVGLAGITCVAAIKGVLGRGMNELQMDPSQQQELVEQSAAIVYTSESTTASTTANITAQTDDKTVANADKITVVPEAVVADERCAFISFKVSGFTFDDTINEPFFDMEYAYEDEAMTKELDCEGRFYNGVNDIGGKQVYEDGTPLQYYNSGVEKYRYFDNEGNLYYLMKVSGHGVDMNMLGRTIYVKLVNLCELYKCEVIKGTNREWTFTLEMPSKSTSVNKDVGKKLENTPFTLDSIGLSPISIRLNYTVKGNAKGTIPKFVGVVLKDGTVLGIGDDVHNSSDGNTAHQNCFFVRAIDPDKVESILILKDMDDPSSGVVTIPV